MTQRALLLSLFNAALAAGDPLQCVPRHLPAQPRGRTLVIGAGKAAAAMARAVEDHWPGPLSGLVITRYGHGHPCRRIEVVEAAHPVPDIQGVTAARRIVNLVRNLSVDDLVICLISGGGSSLMCLPPDDVSLADKQSLTQSLLRSGATIDEINTVRRHLSLIKGGRLAQACYPARVVTLMISDVPGDDLSTIASGPTIRDLTSSIDALAILSRYDIAPPSSIIRHLNAAQDEAISERIFENVENHLIATPAMALEAAAAAARSQGVKAIILGDAIEGEARDVAATMAQTAVSARMPCVLLSGGETTVTIRGTGRGGRNTEFLLALAIELGGHDQIHALACDTDGIDGSEDNAGAIITPDTLIRAAKAGLDPSAFLANNDAYSFFLNLDDLVVTGPTRTNVNDFRAILISK